MAKYYGKIGYYLDNIEVEPGIWENKMEERSVYGDFIRIFNHSENPGQINDNIKISHQVSFVADPYAMNNVEKIKYATYCGSKWSVVSFEIAYPRIILNLGGIYNERQQ